MSEQKTVFVRFGGFIEKLPVESEQNGILKTARSQRGLEAECAPGNIANVAMYRDDIKIFDGLGEWSDTEYKPQLAELVRISGKIWNVTDGRWRILPQAIRVRAELNEELEYEWEMDGKTWTCDCDQVG